MNFQHTWSIDWIQDYESPWGIFEKFKFANVIEANTIFKLIANDNIKHLKNVSTAGDMHRCLIYMHSIDSELSEKIFGLDLKQYQNNLAEKTLRVIPNIKNIDEFFNSRISYCPICLGKGYHSIFHQLKIFEHCPFHPDHKIIKRCVNCNYFMPEYLLKKGGKEPFRCRCGHSFLEDRRLVFEIWKKQLKIKNKVIKLWLDLPKKKVHQYHIIFPFNNYKKHTQTGINSTDYLKLIPKMLTNSFNLNEFNHEVIKLSSHIKIFNIKYDYRQLKENYIKSFPDLISIDYSSEKYRMDSIYFEIYKQSRCIYKAISRYIIRKIIKEHSNCVKTFNKLEFGEPCPHALAFILWKMECENKKLGKIENPKEFSEDLNFTVLQNQFSVFGHGVFMTHIEKILNSEARAETKFDIFKCNISSINYILNQVISYLLIERFIKWLELIQNHNESASPDDNIPMYIVKIPLKYDEEISFCFPRGRHDYMKDIVKDITLRIMCPNKSPEYKNPLVRAFEKAKLW